MSFIKAFAIAPVHNTGGKNDATGAFLPGAKKFYTAYKCPWRHFDNLKGGKDAVRERFFQAIKQSCPPGVNYFAYFGHGIAAGLASPHVYGDNLDELVAILKPKISKPFVAMLYACSSGAAQGFSGKLREKLGDSVWVYGHTTVGHAFLNPDVSEEASNNSPTWRMLYPSGNDLRGAWYDALKYTDLWLRFPLLEDADIYAEVNARRLLGTWEVKSSGAASHYVFDMPAITWNIDSGRDINEAPSGTVKEVDPKKPSSAVDKGTWEITDKLSISWDSGSTETWSLPLHMVGQQGTSDSTPISARRLKHSEGHGKIQG